MLWFLGWVFTILGWAFMWWLSGVGLLILGIYLVGKLDPNEAVDCVKLEEAIEGAGIAFFGPILIGIGIYALCSELKKNKGKIIVWKSKAYKTKEVLGLDHRGLKK